MKSLHNSDISGTSKNVPDVRVFGDGDAWRLICKASSEAEGWMKSTKAMPVEGLGCLVQVTTQQGEMIAEAVTFVPGAEIVERFDSPAHGGTVVGRHLRRAGCEV
jgi:hypothetical protein